MNHLMPLTADAAYNRNVADLASARGVDTVHFSHKLCHNADDLMDSPEQAANMRDLLRMYRDHGIKVWCWTHEVKNPPAQLVDDGKLLADEDALYTHLEKKYATFFQETLPGLEGLVLTFAETQFPVYQEDRIKSTLDRGARTERLIRHMHGICRRHGKGLAIRDFVYRVDEVKAFRDVIQRLPEDVVIMSKCVPHDWHPYYPDNPLGGDVGGRTQWIEHDFGLEYEGQHLYPYANFPEIFRRYRHGHASGCRTLCLRLDRYAGDFGQSAIHTPWGKILLQSALSFEANPNLTLDEFWAQVPEGGLIRPLLESSTEAVCGFLFPMHFWFGDHSNLPSHHYARTHLVGGAADRLVDWVGGTLYEERERNFENMPLSFYRELEAEANESLAQVSRCEILLEAFPSELAAEWRPGVENLRLWAELIVSRRDVFFSRRLMEERPTDISEAHLDRKNSEFQALLREAIPRVAEQRLEGRMPNFSRRHPWQNFFV
ncbi:MAG: hypothetical protein LAT83_20750 [Kiritimatiellae bacterium]|nr:hypothetical protein [Kiritimatiellia bacterium]